MLDKIITYSFYLLFFLTPLFWTSLNYELFEFNKMLLTYSFTVVIVGCWILKIINRKSLIFNRTPLDIPLLLFLGANILSTIFSIDKHTSLWGYYSRQNGGLLSIIAYILLYWAFVSNFAAEKIKTLFKFAFACGLIISVWGILEHFGVSPSCVVLRGDFNASCWVQNVQARVFATLGQPNWMAAYLAMLIFPALYFYLTVTTKLSRYTYFIILTTYYLTFTFTYSRGPTLGLIGGMAVFLSLYFIQNTRKDSENQKIRVSGIQKIRLSDLLIHPIFRVLLSFLLINLLFGSALTNFRLVSKFAPPPRPSIGLPTSSVTQLENGGTESGQIRFIVWKGALEIFKHNPIFGTGVETFAYSYYQYRPVEHNKTSEWDFLYNKAHNEYLNYLATTGIVGFGAYSIIIITFIIVILKRKGPERLLLITLLASYISYLIYNFFLFSVVVIAIFFYLFPAIAFVATEAAKPLKLSRLPAFGEARLWRLTSLIYRHPFYTNFTKIIVVFIICFLEFGIVKLYFADVAFAKGQRASEQNNPGKAYNLLSDAVRLKSWEPFYQSELAYAAASAALALKDDDATLSAQLKDQAVFEMEKVLRENPKNVSYLRTAVRAYFELASLDKSYTDKTLQSLEEAIKLAPTDPKLYFNKALVLEFVGKKDQALKALQKAYELKPDFLEVKEKLEEATRSGKP